MAAYTQVSISGYNTSPPSDDGSETEANRLKWSTHKTKLTDPLKTAIEAIDTNVAAAFAAKGAIGTYTAASSRSVTFTGIPSWVTQIEVGFVGISTDGSTAANNLAIRLGDSDGIETTGYSGTTMNPGGSGNSFTVFSTSLQLEATTPAGANSWTGSATITLVDSATNTWVFRAISAMTAGSGDVCYSAGSKALSATLDRVQFLILGSTDSFDAGNINIRYS